MSIGTPVCKTSNSFVKGYLGDRNDYIYLQRGYRQYGQPSVSLNYFLISRIKPYKQLKSSMNRI